MLNTTSFPAEILARIERSRVMAVVTVEHADDAVPLAQAILAGGIAAMELTLRTATAIDAIRLIKTHVPQMLLGAGTVLTPEQVSQVRAAGADFAVAPGMNPRVAQAARELGLPFAAGIATPTDIEQAIEQGCRVLKFFPAEPLGGLVYLKAIAAPYAHLGLKYIPLGSMEVNKAVAYLADPLVCGVGGSWIAPRDLIARRDWKTIEHNAYEAVRVLAVKA